MVILGVAADAREARRGVLGAVQGFIRFADSPSSASSSSSSSTAAVTRDVDLVFNIIDGDAKARKAVALMQERFPDVAIYAVRCGSHIVHNAAQAVCTAIGLGRYVSSGQDNSFLYWAIEKSIIVARSLSGELMAHIAAHGMPSELIQTRWASLFAAAASLCGDRRRSLLLALITIDARDHQSGDVYSSKTTRELARTVLIPLLLSTGVQCRLLFLAKFGELVIKAPAGSVAQMRTMLNFLETHNGLRIFEVHEFIDFWASWCKPCQLPM